MSSNPFFVGQPVPPEHFIGRTSEIEIAFDQISTRSNLAIWGSPGVGKSSFLEQLASPQIWQLQGLEPSNTLVVLLSCLSLEPFSAAKFWQEILTLLKDQLDDEPQLKSEVETLLKTNQGTKDGLRKLLRQLGKKNKFLLLLVDDYDIALYPHQQYTEADIKTFLSECRTLAYSSRERKYLSMVITSIRRLSDLGPKIAQDGSPWYNHYLFQRLKSFTNTEVATLLNLMPMTKAIKDGIREIADGNPALLQIAGFIFYKEWRKREGELPSVENFAREFESATRHFFQDTWTRCDETEQTLLMLIALSSLKGRLHKKQRYDLSDVEIIFTQKERELIELQEQGIIKRTVIDSKTFYSFSSLMMERWVILELGDRGGIGNIDEQYLIDRQKIFLNLMSHKQAKNVTAAIRWLWQHKEEVPSLLEWVGKVAAAFPKGAIG